MRYLRAVLKGKLGPDPGVKAPGKEATCCALAVSHGATNAKEKIYLLAFDRLFYGIMIGVFYQKSQPSYFDFYTLQSLFQLWSICPSNLPIPL